MRISKNLSTLTLICLFVFCISHKCLADSIVYSNFGTGSDVYSDASGFTIIGATSPYGVGYPVGIAFPFTPASTTNFAELDIALNYVAGTDSVTVDLMSDSGGPGAVLESWSASGLPGAECCTFQELAGNGTIPLDAGTTYWVAAQPGAGDTWAFWDQNSTGATGTEYLNLGSGWVLYGENGVGAFEVQGIPPIVPEPGTLGLLGSGLLLGLAGLLWQRFRRSAVQLLT